MKKTYIQPNTKFAKANISNILAGSDIRVMSAGNGSDALGKKNGSAWDDEEDEDF